MFSKTDNMKIMIRVRPDLKHTKHIWDKLQHHALQTKTLT